MLRQVRSDYRGVSKWFIIGCLAATAYGAVDKDPSYCANEPNSIVSDACASFSSLEKLNTDLRPLVQDITQHTDFFGYYRLDLYGRECPFWSDDSGTCGNRACAVDVTDEKDIPEVWRASELGKLAGPKASHPETKVEREEPSPLGGALGPDTSESCVFEPDEIDKRDYCVPEDESPGADCVYVSLKDNPERFTGYAGTSANNVWRAVYQENCFNSQVESQTNSPFFAPSAQFPHAGAASDLKNVMQRKKHELVQQNLTPLGAEEQCLEKRVFYRVVSGMHASISMHLCHDYLNQTTGKWGPNLQCYKDRLHYYPDRMQNLYFNYALLVRAVGKLRNNLKSYTFCSGDPREDRFTKGKVLELANRAASGPKIFDESVMFRDADALTLKEDFRTRFRNVSRIMDCVGCDKCRLWGKIQTSGYGTALKVLFDFDEMAENGSAPKLRRTELVALINTLDRVANSIYAAGVFARMVEREKRLEALSEEGDAAQEAVQAEIEAESYDDYEEKPVDTVKSLFLEEFGIIWQAFRYVLRSWFELPAKAWDIYKWANGVMMDKFLGRDRYQYRPFPYRLYWEKEEL